ncbi:MAG: resolvase [Burkholderiales bacterium RIFCSPLOWO2_02_FULL_66_35]|nr:MAG: resolvase [Burkholderiales bacterium RIFCSPLOWO2_02_FULL_66_35]OGT14450.1 MAG: resolvase [Gallionellales bacterium RIFCSPHIGHO2_02_FULL_57_16]
MLRGYARVSTLDQDTAMQLDALRAAGCRSIVQDKASGVGHRRELQALLLRLRPGDILVVWKLDRIARSLTDLLGIVDQVRAAGASIRSLTEPIDTSNPIGEFTLQVLGAVAQLERSMIRERVIAGQVAAMKRGVVIGGRPRKLGPRQVAVAKRMRDKGSTWPEIGLRLGVSNTTARRAVLGDNRDRMVVLRQYL